MHPEARRFHRLFLSVRPGTILIYHCGNLAMDAPKDEGLTAKRDLVMSLHERRLGLLSQRRVDDGVREYRIQKAVDPTPGDEE